MFLSHVLAILLVITAMASILITHEFWKGRSWKSSPTLMIVSELIFLVGALSCAWSLEHPPTEEVARRAWSVEGFSMAEIERPGEVLPVNTSVNCAFSNTGTRAVRIEALQEAVRGGDESQWAKLLNPGESFEIPYSYCPKLKVYSKRGALLGVIL